ncbi:protease [Halobacteriales archaeon QH_8_68_33]|nr:MAG: protease [Halobacteriales archaeon QH_8_68_33]
MQSSVLGWIGNNLPLFLLFAGAGLTIAEAFAPGAHFIVLGVALLVAGLVGLVLPSSMGLIAPAILAAVVLGAGAATFYVYRQFDFYGGKGGEQTSDSDSLRGATGRIAEGTEVMVMDPGGGNVVEVAPVEGFDEIERELERGRTGGDRTGDPAPRDRDGRDSEDPGDREFERDTA